VPTLEDLCRAFQLAETALDGIASGRSASGHISTGEQGRPPIR